LRLITECTTAKHPMKREKLSGTDRAFPASIAVASSVRGVFYCLCQHSSLSFVGL
jgi:hypothetical protein